MKLPKLQLGIVIDQKATNIARIWGFEIRLYGITWGNWGLGMLWSKKIGPELQLNPENW